MTVAILLAGGKGVRFGGAVPKQFQPVGKQPLVLYSFSLFTTHPAIDQVVVVVDKPYQHLFDHPKVLFASPGVRRQDSLQNGLKAASKEHKLVIIHDAARPLANAMMIDQVIAGAKEVGACAVGIPLKFTVKQVDQNNRVVKTVDRSTLFEIQTPQALRRDILEKGLALHIEVTDDVSFAEALGLPVLIVEGAHSNIKVTTKEDLLFVEAYLAL